MRIRELKEHDSALIAAMHSDMGFNYLLPDFKAQDSILSRVAENGSGIIAAAHFRHEAEAYLFLDFDASPRARWNAISALDCECSKALRSLGLRDEVAWIPRNIEDNFAHALVKLGFRRARSEFSAWSKEL